MYYVPCGKKNPDIQNDFGGPLSIQCCKKPVTIKYMYMKDIEDLLIVL